MPIFEPKIMHLAHQDALSRFDYQCGHCGRLVSGRVPSIYSETTNTVCPIIRFLICPSCITGSVWNCGKVFPGINPGESLEGLSPVINETYEEARACFSVNAFTACELLCRKILMHIAVDKGAIEGKSFSNYLKYLEDEGFITPTIKSWADRIRTNGNDSTHKITSSSKEKAEDTFSFTMQLLRIIYEMDYKAKKYSPPTEEV
jgi:hypothetical protein